MASNWILRHDGLAYDTFTGSMEDALQIARDDVDKDDVIDETIFVIVEVMCDESHEKDSDIVACHPKVPECSAGEHDWMQQSVMGHGGGVICTDQCRHCKLVRRTDTWWQDMQTGEQGLLSISYPAQYDDES